MPTLDCHFCQKPASVVILDGAKKFECLFCGTYKISEESYDDFEGMQNAQKEKARPLLSHKIKWMQFSNRVAIITTEFIDSVTENSTLANPAQQKENLILWFGKRQERTDDYGEKFIVLSAELAPICGAKNDKNAAPIWRYLKEEGLVIAGEFTGTQGRPIQCTAQITFKGWEYYQRLRESKGDGKQAFMAMPFGNDDLTSLFRNNLKPAVLCAGFNLHRLDERPTAGLIDDLLRVEIRRSRLLIAEISHQNYNVYWEAGFAEALGIPVIYMCEKTAWENVKQVFDTNHMQTIIWSMDNLQDSCDRLVASIRATLPAEAKMQD